MLAKIKLYFLILVILSSCTGIVVSVTKLYFSFKSNIEKVTTLSIQNKMLQQQLLKQNQVLAILQSDIKKIGEIQENIQSLKIKTDASMKEFKESLKDKKVIENTNLINEQYDKIEKLTNEDR